MINFYRDAHSLCLSLFLTLVYARQLTNDDLQ